MTSAPTLNATDDTPYLRAEVVIHLPTSWTPGQHVTMWNHVAEPLHGFIEDTVEMVEDEKEALFAALPGLADVVATEDEDEQGEALADWVQRRAPKGFLVKVALPRWTQRYSCWFRWVHGETVPAAIASAEAWARRTRVEDMA